jgi:hypothetical protein
MLAWPNAEMGQQSGVRSQHHRMKYSIMMVYMLKVTTTFAALLPEIVLGAPQPYCKPVPSSPGWPSITDWQVLNASVSGRLLAPVPPGAVCHTTSPLFNNASCASVYSQWSNSSFHAHDAFTSDYNDDTCLPSPLVPCSAAGYPAFVINATNATHVQEGVKFAHRTGIRLVVKGTGHDIPGR